MSLKKIIQNLFPGLVDYRNRLYNKWKHSRFKGQPIKDVFNDIYLKNHWRDQESHSGTGSNQVQTTEVKRILLEAIHSFEMTSMLDAPCGDFNWMKEVPLKDVKYYGADIVEDLINRNNKDYASANRSFFYADITSSDLPEVDLLFCRDCLVHLSYKDINKAIENIKRSRTRYLLTTTFVAHTNYDIVTGNWRPVNLESAPFNFPAPIKVFNELCTEDQRYADKSLALWRVTSL
jgi:SAM-dependent methyltransferase